MINFICIELAGMSELIMFTLGYLPSETSAVVMCSFCKELFSIYINCRCAEVCEFG